MSAATLRKLVPLYVAIFIDVIGFTFLIPLLPALGSAFHASAGLMGALVSASAAVAALSSPFWGRLSDRLGRKPVLLTSQCFTLIGYLALALAPNIPLLFAARAIQGIGGGNLGVAQSYAVDVARKDERATALAWSSAIFGAGFIVGPVLSGLLYHFGLRVPFWVAAGLEALNLVLTVTFLPAVEAQDRGTASTRSILAHLRAPAMLRLMVRRGLYIFAFTYFFAIFGLYLSRRLDLGPSSSALLLAVAGGVGAAMLIFAVDRLDRRFGTPALAQIGFVCAFVAYAYLGFAQSLAGFVIALVLWAAGGAVLRPTLSKLIADDAPAEERGAMLGFADSLDNGAMIVAPALGGIVLGAAPQFSGAIPAACVALAFGLGLPRR